MPKREGESHPIDAPCAKHAKLAEYAIIFNAEINLIDQSYRKTQRETDFLHD